MTPNPASAASLHVVCPHCTTTNRVARDRRDDAPSCGHCKALLFPAGAVALTAESFDRHVAASGDLPLIVDFWASWCGPCRMMAPAYDEAASRLRPKVRLAKLDTEAQQAIAARFGIRSIPTLVAFRDGREVARQSGALQLPQLMQWIAAHAQN